MYQENNKFQKAIIILEEILIARKEILGSDHPDVANTLNNLASNYEGLGMLGKAEENYKNAHIISEKKLGKYHPLTNQILINPINFKQPNPNRIKFHQIKTKQSTAK